MNEPTPKDVARRLRAEARRLENAPTPEQVAARLRRMAVELEEAARRLEQYTAAGGA